MKIYTITCSNVYNYGAILQSFALQNYLEGLGHEVKIIDYVPPYLRKISAKYRKNIVARIARKLLYAPDYYKSSKVFTAFKHQYIHQTTICYNLSDVRALPQPNLYIAGSDQIWNPYLNNGWDQTYYINIPGVNKVAFAASIGCKDVGDSFASFLKNMLSGFKNIYVREKHSVKQLHNWGIDADYVMDPVYLLSCGEWSKLCAETPKEKYIVVYALHHMQGIYDYAKHLAKSLGVKMYVINVEIKEMRRGGDKFFWNPTVQQFLSLLCNAEAIVSNSFHGVSFGLIFKRPIHIFDTENNDIRISNIVNLLRLEDRLCNIADTRNLKPNTTSVESFQLLDSEIARSKMILNQITKEYE